VRCQVRHGPRTTARCFEHLPGQCGHSGVTIPCPGEPSGTEMEDVATPVGDHKRDALPRAAVSSACRSERTLFASLGPTWAIWQRYRVIPLRCVPLPRPDVTASVVSTSPLERIAMSFFFFHLRLARLHNGLVRGSRRWPARRQNRFALPCACDPPRTNLGLAPRDLSQRQAETLLPWPATACAGIFASASENTRARCAQLPSASVITLLLR